MQKILIATVFCSGCFAFMTKQEGQEMKDQINEVRNLSTKNEQRAAELAKLMDDQLRRVKLVVEEATKVVTRNSADVGLTVQKLQQDLAQITGRIDDLQHSEDALTKQFQDYRAASDTKIEQLVNNSAQAKNPPMPETPDALYAEGEKRLQAQQLAKSFSIVSWTIEAGPSFFDEVAGKLPITIKAIREKIALENGSFYRSAKP